MKKNHYKVKKIIGGEFELNIDSLNFDSNIDKYISKEEGTWTTSGRQAFCLILNQLKSIGVKQIFLPSFLCNSILIPVLRSGLKFEFYKVHHDLSSDINPSKGSAILIIHYFGWFNPLASDLRKQSESFYLIEDATHIFLNSDYQLNSDRYYTFVSLRKHAGTIMGGWLNQSIKLPESEKKVKRIALESLAARFLKNIYISDKNQNIDELFEKEYLNIFEYCEGFINEDKSSALIPNVAKYIIDSIDWHFIVRKRRENWLLLDELLDSKFKKINNRLDNGIVPLGYVIKTDNRTLIKKKLAKNKIYAPIHWPIPTLLDEKLFSCSLELYDKILTIPIDQRYNHREIKYIAKNLLELH